MTDSTLDLDARLAALAARAPGRDDPPPLNPGRRRPRLMVAAALALTVVAAAGGAVVAVNQLVRSYPGIENPGQPLAGANLECMSPPDAAAFLAAHGYTKVVWQVESGVVDGAKGTNRSIQQSTPPEHGYVVPVAVLDDGRLHMIADQREGATGTGPCYGMPMP